ncbi:MAG: hypothetical protein ACPF9I_06505 [Candidatus Thalassarchaeaceae archaeon]|jgi:hypothetical protein|tara:strand:+ start:5314 stop:5538 length:225 start_codon:yes stop_codon:yes gene_type:complete
MWPFTTRQERQAEAMSQILAENSYERKLERIAGWVRTFVALFLGISLTFLTLFLLEEIGNFTPSDIWDWINANV